MMINMYFDTEFTGLRSKTDLISIGLLIGKKFFYGEIMDVDVSEDLVGKDTYRFLKKEVFPGLIYGELPTTAMHENTSQGTIVVDKKEEVSRSLIKFLFGYVNANPRCKICPISDVMYYDMILFMDLLNVYEPKNQEEYEMCKRVRDAVSPAGIDINDLIMRFDYVDIITAFNLNREEFLSRINPDSPSSMFPGKKHNALYDARIIKAIYESLLNKHADIIKSPVHLFVDSGLGW